MQFLRDLRAVCDEYGIILGMDEVQSGMGRTGKLFAHEWAGITPDVMSAAKGIGGGFPLGAVLAKEAVRQGAEARHARHHVRRQSARLRRGQRGARRDPRARLPGGASSARAASCAPRLDKLAREFPQVYEDARGMGLLQGLKCVLPQGEVQAACVAEGLMAITAGENVLRLAPPLVVTDADLDEAMAMLRRATLRVLPSNAKAAAK